MGISTGGKALWWRAAKGRYSSVLYYGNTSVTSDELNVTEVQPKKRRCSFHDARVEVLFYFVLFVSVDDAAR